MGMRGGILQQGRSNLELQFPDSPYEEFLLGDTNLHEFFFLFREWFGGSFLPWWREYQKLISLAFQGRANLCHDQVLALIDVW